MRSTPLFYYLLLLLLTAGPLALNAQGNKVVIGAIDSLESKILGEKRKVWVYVPDQEGADTYGPQRYPVVYLLDGDAHFYSVVGMIQQLSSVNGNMNCPKMIVVGIPNTDRNRDLTPTHVDADPPYIDSISCKTTGGGENFIAFIEKELMPHIEAKYPAAPYKMLIGHSFGGLTVMNAFVHHTGLFNSYICIDPSMWWDDRKLLKQAQKALAERRFEGKSLYLGIANTMDEGMDITMVQKDTSIDTEHIRSILALQSYFENNSRNGLKYRGKYYPEDTHGSAPLITEYDALRFIFDFHPLKFSSRDYTDSTDAQVDKYRNHFARISAKMGYTAKPDEAEINFMGYYALQNKYFKKAEGFFRLNVDNYPGSYNVYDAYGDYFIAQKDTANAIIQLKKALAIKENAGSRQKLEGLEGSAKTMTQTADGKWVIADSKKTALYEVFIYDNGPDYPSEGLIRVLKNGKIGYADANTYAIVIEPQFDCAFPFENGKAKVSNQCRKVKEGEHGIWKSEAWRYVDKKGKMLD